MTRFTTSLLSFRYIQTISLVLLILIHTGEQASTANPSFNTTIFNETVNFRQDVCYRHAKFSRGEILLKDALEGLSIRAVLGKGIYLNLQSDGYTIQDGDPGLVVDILDEIAKRGKFKWRDSFTVSPYLDTELTGKSWTDFLIWQTNVYDIAIDWWLHTPDRVAKGAVFPKGWFDASIIIVGAIEEMEENAFKPLSWTEPFTYGVWLLMLATLFISGYLYLHIDRDAEITNYQSSHGYFNDEELPRDAIIRSLQSMGRKGMLEKEESLANSIYQSFMVFTGHLDLQAQTVSGQMIALSLSFFAMLMLSAYTANLATSLVVTSIPSSTISNVKDIVDEELTMCILSGSAFEETIALNNPGAVLVKKSTDRDIIDGLNNKDCDYAITSATYWKAAQKSFQHNSACNLTQVGRLVEVYEAGFVTKSDAGTLCTSLIRDVFDAHLREMDRDGFLKKGWDEVFNKNSEVACSDSGMGLQGVNEDVQKLNLKSMGGIFILHFSVIAIACILSPLIKLVAKKREQFTTRREIVEEAAGNISDNDAVTPKPTVTDLSNEISEMKAQQADMTRDLKSIKEHILTQDTASLKEQLGIILKHLNEGEK